MKVRVHIILLHFPPQDFIIYSFERSTCTNFANRNVMTDAKITNEMKCTKNKIKNFSHLFIFTPTFFSNFFHHVGGLDCTEEKKSE